MASEQIKTIERILVDSRVVTPDQLLHAEQEVTKTGDKVTNALVRLGYLREETLLKAIVAQKNIRIGDILLSMNLITHKQLELAVAEQNKSGGRLGNVLVRMGFVSQTRLLQVIAAQLDIPFVDLKAQELKSELVRMIPEIQARRFKVVILSEEKTGLLIGMTDPQNIFAVDAVGKLLNQPFKIALVDEHLMVAAFDRFYDHAKDISRFAEQLSEEVGDPTESAISFGESMADEDVPVVKMLHSVFSEAVRQKASDIHIEPDAEVLRIRLRVDGVLQEQTVKETNITQALTQRLKLMGGLNIAERRLPQDGRFSIRVKDQKVEVRLSTLPTQFGESVVMRLLQRKLQDLRLDLLGMPPDILKTFRKLINNPHGMMVVTGPTGSGKTTTLYSGLLELNDPKVKIITVEDPVEYRIPRVNQVQVSTKVDLTFSRVLRAALRQDPDVIMVGEIRDGESATIALRAAMTGHLVLATLHTTDAQSSPMRLMDMGVPNYLVAAALRAVLAQRLLRRICENCRQPYQPNAQETSWLRSMFREGDSSTIQYYQGAGCGQCQESGCSGRIGVYQLLVMTPPLIEALRENNPVRFHQALAIDESYQSLSRRALTLAQEGVISLQEVLRITEDISDSD